jgi:hypothetical protein
LTIDGEGRKIIEEIRFWPTLCYTRILGEKRIYRIVLLDEAEAASEKLDFLDAKSRRDLVKQKADLDLRLMALNKK